MLDSDMTEQGRNNLLAGDYQEAEGLDDEFIPSDARPVCFKCLKPCHPLQYYCDSCDSNEVINPLASYMPFVRIRFNIGMFCKMWRRIWYDKDTSIIRKVFFLLLIIYGAPILLIVGLPLFFIGKIKEPQLRKTATTAFYILVVVLLIIFFTLYYLSL